MFFLSVFRFNYLDWRITWHSSGSNSTAVREPQSYEAAALLSDIKLLRACGQKMAKKETGGLQKCLGSVQANYIRDLQEMVSRLGQCLKWQEGLEETFMKQLWLVGATITAALSRHRKTWLLLMFTLWKYREADTRKKVSLSWEA